MPPPPPLPLVVYSHLRWDFVFQRPQHLLSRLAARRRIAFVEEPLVDASRPPFWDVSEPVPGVLRCRPTLPVGGYGFGDAQTAPLASLARELLTSDGFARHVAWLYTPMALPLARALAPAAIVYDCMDELSAFHGAPPGLVEREQQLLALADVVFTGGPSLYRAKRDRHPRVLCLPSSVDVAHYRRALDGLPEPADQAGLPRPRLGYFGVLDERLDRDLLGHVAAARPDWQLVLVGPVVKIDPASLPRRPNIAYLGQRGYEDLPAYLAGWDVALLPFALNQATRFISPTKTLEYMAADRPIVGTPVRDVAEPYGHVVRIAENGPAFVAACEAALREPADARRAEMRRIVGGTSWEATAAVMEEAIADALRRRRAVRGDAAWRPTTSSSSAPGLPA